jgi:hypothetical protein
VLISFLVVPGTRTEALAQEETKEEYHFYSFSLKHASPDAVVPIIKDVVNGVTVVKVGPHSIIVGATRLQAEKVRGFIESVDVAASESPQLVRIFFLKYARAVQAFDVLTSLDVEANITVDERTNSIVASANEEVFATIEAVLQALDRPVSPGDSQSAEDGEGRDLFVRVVWVIDGSTLRSNSPPLGGALESIKTELEQVGITDPRVAGQLIVRTGGARQFRAAGRAIVGGPCSLMTSGETRFVSGGNVHLQIALNASSEKEGWTNPEEGSHIQLNLETEIQSPLGHLVILGAAPTGSATSAFVIQIREASPAASGGPAP